MRTYHFVTKVKRGSDTPWKFTTLTGHHGYKSAVAVAVPGDRIEMTRFAYEGDALVDETVEIDREVAE